MALALACGGAAAGEQGRPLDVAFAPRPGGFETVAQQGAAAWLRLAGGRDGALESSAPLAPGWHCLDAEYRTEGIDLVGGFNADVLAPSYKPRFSSYEFHQAASAWAPFRIYFLLEHPSKALLRLGALRGAGPKAAVWLRRIAIRRFQLEEGENILGNADFAAGTVGEIPPLWHWKYKPAPAGHYAIAANTTYRTGRHILRLKSDGKDSRTLYGKMLPLPTEGEIVFTVWARSDAPKALLTMHLTVDGWQPRAEARHQLTPAWKRHVVKLQVPGDGKKKFFWPRVDINAIAGAVDVADASVEWYPSGRKAEGGTTELHVGWPGVPGRNLILNPDFELDGTGWTYDFFHPKLGQTERAAVTGRSKPVAILAGKGVDGGACAWIPGAGPALRAFCIPLKVGATYTVSAWLRAPEGTQAAELWWAVIDPAWAMVANSAKGIPSDRWERRHFTFTWTKPSKQKRAYLRLDSGTGVLVDRVQVEQGALTDYEPPPVMLALLADPRPYFIRGRDAARMTLRVVPGTPRSGTVAIDVTATDAWKRVAWKRHLDVPADRPSQQPIDLPTDRLGTFHVALEATAGKRSLGTGISRYAIIDPPRVQAVGPGRPGLFGVCMETWKFPQWWCAQAAQVLKDMGVRLNRFFASAVHTTRVPPDELIADLRERCRVQREAGIDLIACVGPLGPAARDTSNRLDMAPPEAPRQHAEYLGPYVRALKNEVRYWEIFNEPNLWRVPSGPNKGKRTMYPRKYIEFQKAAYRAIKDVDPQLTVVANALNGTRTDWIAEWAGLGAAKHMDIFSFHSYRSHPDQPDTCDDIAAMREVLAKHGFRGPILNSEQYFAANLFYLRGSDEESRRGYYVPHGQELRAAGRTIRNFIHHAAAGAPYCAFAINVTAFRPGPGRELLLQDLFAAYNAATRFLVGAGTGRKLSLGPSLRAFLFESPPEGPLLALWTPLPSTDARMLLEGDFAAFDIMGNPYSPQEKKQGLRVATDPVYVRYKPGTAPAAIQSALERAEIIGLGDPLQIDLVLAGPKTLTARLRGCRTRPLSGTVRLVGLPEGWTCPEARQAFSDLRAGQVRDVAFRFTAMAVASLGRYPVTVLVESGKEFVRRQLVLRPVYATRLAGVKADGDLSEWRAAAWFALGEDHLSRDFTPALEHAGAADLAARVACAWTPDGLALAAEVTDDRHHTAPSEGVAWQGDSVQVYFDPLNNAAPDAPAHHVDDDVAYTLSLIRGKPYAWLDKGAEGNYKGKANRREGFADPDVQAAIRREGTTTVYEMLFPRARCIPAARLAAGRSFGFSLLINDNDGQGRKTGVTLAPKGKEPYGAPHEYRDLMLLPATPPPVGHTP